MRGYSYDRRDVTGRGLANAYAQTLGTIFSSGGEKPYEVEIVVAEVGDAADDDQIYRLTYDGSVADEHGFVVMGGPAEAIADALERALAADGLALSRGAVGSAVELLGRSTAAAEPPDARARPSSRWPSSTGPRPAAEVPPARRPGSTAARRPRPDHGRPAHRRPAPEAARR